MPRQIRNHTIALLWNIQRSIEYFDLLVELEKEHSAYVKAIKAAKKPSQLPKPLDPKLITTRRSLRDALVVRVAAIFEDTDYKPKTISLSKFLNPGNITKVVKRQKIIEKIIKDRHSFTAHMASATSSVLQVEEIVHSNLRNLLKGLERMVQLGNLKWTASD